MNKWWLLPILFSLVLFWLVNQWPDGRVKVVFCDVGQGDSQLVIWNDVQVVIDGGPNEEGVLKCLGRHMPFWDRNIELVVSTHPDKDHVGGLDEVLERYGVGTILTNDIEGANEDARAFKKLLSDKKVYVPSGGEEIKVGELRFRVMWPRIEDGGDFKETNEWSIVLKLSFGDFDALFTGDISQKQEDLIPGLSDIEILKVAHHGSRFASSSKFLKAVTPELAVIEVGKNSYGHPTNEVLDRLKSLGIRTLRTDQDGEVVVVSDGESWWLR